MNRIKELKEVNWRELKPLQPDNAKIVFNYQAIENSLKKYGFAQPFFGWEYEGAVYTIDGHTRKEVLSNMQNVPETLPCVLVDAKDRKEAIEMLIEVYNQKHNPFDIEVLEEMIEIDQLDVDIDTINVKIETEEIEEVEHLEAEEDDFDAEPPAEPITVLGDLYEIGEHRLLCGDSTDSDQVAKLMNGQKADMVFTDPPYDLENENYHSNILLYSENAHIFVMHDDKGIVNYLRLSNLEFSRFYVANFGFSSPRGNDPYLSHILISQEKNGKPIPHKNMHDGFRSIIPMEYRFRLKDDKTEHKHQKPIKFVSTFIEHFSNESSIIFDLFTGSGTTMVSSHKTNRKCYGMELDQKYCDVIVKRMLKLDDKLTVKRNGIDCTKEFKD